ncbi:MAG: SPFH domain-containing protein, partial [Myxococcota bacterium]|nr:SPFH domain-containing protein [Myxococcota bacterium]
EFEGRAQLLRVEPFEAFTKDTKNLVLTPIVIWKVSDPTLFLQRIRTEEGAQRPLRDLVTSYIAASIGKRNFSDVLSIKTTPEPLLPTTLRQAVDAETNQFGISVQEIQIVEFRLPVQNEQSIYERMRAERSRIANRYRSEGKEKADGIRAKADREAVEITSNAQKEGAEIRAKAEKFASEQYAKTYAQNPELYRLLRDLESIEASFQSGGHIILPLNERPFQTLFQNEKGR